KVARRAALAMQEPPHLFFRHILMVIHAIRIPGFSAQRALDIHISTSFSAHPKEMSREAQHLPCSPSLDRPSFVIMSPLMPGGKGDLLTIGKCLAHRRRFSARSPLPSPTN